MVFDELQRLVGQVQRAVDVLLPHGVVDALGGGGGFWGFGFIRGGGGGGGGGGGDLVVTFYREDEPVMTQSLNVRAE